jgi:hypothetical protein
MDTINLHLDSDNELLFKVTVEGSREAETTCRLMLEKDDFSYMFTGGVSADGEVKVTIPTLKKNLTEGSYNAHLEVLVDDRIFVPLTFNANFTESVKVTAESITRTSKKSVGASAKIISSTQPKKTRVVSETKQPQNSKIDVSKLSKGQMRDLVRLLEKKSGK